MTESATLSQSANLKQLRKKSRTCKFVDNQLGKQVQESDGTWTQRPIIDYIDIIDNVILTNGIAGG